MADKKFDLVFNASLEVGQVKSAVASLTKSLENAGAKIPQSMASNLNRMIQSLNTELNKLEGMTDIQLDPKNAKNVGKSYEKIFQTFQQIKAALGDIHRTAGIDPEKFFPSEITSNISKAAQAVQKYKKTMEAGIKTEDHSQITKDMAKAAKEAENLQKKLNEATMKRDEASNTKQALQNQRAELQAKKEAAEAEVKAAKEAEKVVNDKIDSQKKLAQIEAEIAKKKKAQQDAVNKAAKANEIKNERESMKQAKNKGTDTKIYRDAVASYTESTAEVQRLEGEIKQLETQYTQLSQAAVASADEQAAATERVEKATEKLRETQASLKKNQSAMDTEDAHYAAAVGEIQTLTPAVKQAEQALEQLRLKKQQLESSFEQSTFDELIQELEKLGIKLPNTERNMEGVERALQSMAAEAKGKVVQAFNSVETATEEVNQALKQTGQVADDFDALRKEASRAEQDMENLKNQVLDFFSITNTIQIFKNAIRDAFDTVKELDAAMTETAVVTDFSVGDMWDKLPQYSEEATKLGASIKSLYEATTLYYQQGLNSEQAMGVGIETMKMARIANMDAAQATEAMTAALRGFNMEIDEMSATRINDVYSELAAVTAADTSQIATAMSKTASIAESANMEFETTAALLAQIIETTQEAPETAGTAMKTIIARFTEVKQLFSEGMLTGEDSEGEEININKIDAALKTVGISLKDFLTGAKGIDDIFLELASKWDTLDLATQRYIATTAAGSRQQSRFLAMMGNYDRTMELVTAANNSAGASAQQFDKTLESLESKLQRLQNAWAEFTMGLANNELIKFGVDLLTAFVTVVNKVTDALPGATGNIAKLLITIGSLKAGGAIFDSFFQNLKRTGAEAMGPFQALWSALTDNVKLLGENITGIGTKIKALGGFSGAIKVLTTAFFGTSKAARVAAVETLGFSSALATTPIGWIAIAIAALIALIYGLVKAWQAASDAFKMNAINDSINQMTSNIEDAKKAIDDLKNSKSTLKTLQDEFSGLTKGTQEWKEKLIEVNQQVLNLLEKYPELSSHITRTDFGTLDIKDSGWDALLEAQQQIVVNSTNARIGMQYSKADLQEKIDYERILTESLGKLVGDSIDAEGFGRNVGTALGTVIGGTGMGLFGSLAGPGGTAAGIAAGGIWGGTTGANLGAQWGVENSKAIKDGFANVTEWASQALLDGAAFLDTGWGKFFGGLAANYVSTTNPLLGWAFGADLALNGDESYEERAQRALGGGFSQDEMSELFAALGDAQITFDTKNGFSDTQALQSVLDGLGFETSIEQVTALANKLGDSFNELTTSALEYSLAKEGQRDGLIASGVANSAIGGKMYADAIGNILGETIYENIEPMLEQKQSALPNNKKELKELYAQEVGGHYENGKLYSDASMATEWDLSKETMKQAIASAQLAKEMGASAEKLGEILDQRSLSERKMFSQIFSSDGMGITDETYFNLLKRGEGRTDSDWIAESLGYENLQLLADDLGIDIKEVGEILSTNLNAARNRIMNARKATVGSMKKYGKTSDSYDKHAQDLARMEELHGPDFNQQLSSMFDSVTRSGDDELTSKVFEQYMKIAEQGNKYALQEANKLVEDIDWSNPIQAISRLRKEAEGGASEIKEMANAILQVGEKAYSSGSQMQYFVQSESFEGLRESIQGIIDTEGELSAANILEMADECSDLKKIMDQTEASAAGMAKALTMLETGELTVNQLTDAVMASLKSFDSLDSLVAKTLKTLSEFDFGPNENEISDSITEMFEAVDENLKKGAVGNSQIDTIYDFMFGKDWDKDLEGDVLLNRIKHYRDWLKNNSEDTYSAWKDIAEGRSITGGQLNYDALGTLRITKNANGSIDLNGFEGMTSKEVAGRIAEAYGTSELGGDVLLTGFKNYSLDLKKELNINDFNTALQDSIAGLKYINQVNSHNEDLQGGYYSSRRVIDDSEIKAIADIYGQDYKDVRKKYEEDNNVFVTDLYDDNGNILQGKDLIAELDRTFTSVQGQKNGAEWYAGFTKKVNGETIIDYEGMMTQLGKLNIPESAKVAMATDIVESIRQGTAEGQSVFIDYEFSDGMTRKIEIPAGIDVQTAIANAEEELKNEKLGEAIANAFGDIDVSFNIDENGVGQITTAVEGAVKQANTTIEPKVSDGSKQQISKDITGAVSGTKPWTTATVYANTSPITNAVNNLTLEKEVILKPVYSEEVGKPKAKGVKNSHLDEIALIGEEGAEIHQTKDGVYLATGPQFAHIEKGDSVYTAAETKKILSASSVKIPRYATGFNPDWGYTGSGGKNASSKSDNDKEDWENPFDKLYNLIREIDEELRRRERLERRYEKLLESVDLTAGKLFDNAVEQLKQLEKEKLLNKELQEARRSQIQQYQQENADLMKYAKVVQNERGEDVLRIHWDQINLVEDPEQGQRIEDYVSQLEEWFDSLEEAEDKLNDIEDRIEEVKELGKEEYLDFENAVKDAITFAYQEEIDKLSEINESINDTNTQLIDAISKQVNRMRQQRENERTEQELQEKQRQLLYLSQDTSGANDMAILELQREIEEGTVDYTDTLIDQKIDELQTQNDEAAQQREQQITLMQAQLDHLIQSGEIWDEVYSLMDEGLDPEVGLVRGSRLEQMLKSAEGFQGMSKIQQMDWLKELQQQAAQAVTYMRLTTEKIDTAVELNRQNYFGPTTPEPSYSGSSGSSGGGGSGGSGGGISNSTTNSTTKPSTTTTTETVKTWYIYTSTGGSYIGTYTGTKSEVYAKYPGYTISSTKISAPGSTSAPEQHQWKIYTPGGMYITTFTGNSAQLSKNFPSSSYKYVKVYKKGGLADFTGPAWLDGTKSRPELVLNARDTQNFIQLKDILASLMTSGPHSSTENNGDITYDIDINVESISSDYDVEQVANKVKSLINEDARYRNNNAVSLKR